MRSSNTFGLHFVLRPAQKENHAIYVRIVVNGTRCELALNQTIGKKDWNAEKGAARPKTPELKQLNSYLEEVRAKLTTCYQQLNLSGDYLTAQMLKNSYLGMYSYNVTVELNQPVVTVSNGARMSAATWSSVYLGTVVVKDMSKAVREKVGDLVDTFLNAFLSVNPK